MLAPRDIPNLISIARILMVAPLVVLLLHRRFDVALALFLLAGLSDALDGFLAKHYHWQSRLGGILDPLADKLLLVATTLSLGWLGILPLWLVGLVLARDLIIVFGALAYDVLIAEIQPEPTPISKLNTLLQILLVLTAIFGVAVMPVPNGLMQGLIGAVALTTLASGVLYVMDWSHRARRNGRKRE
jgi:cardiolipin synthase